MSPRSNRAAFGPRRSPQPVRGPVSLRLKNSGQAAGWVEKKFPHFSVTREAWDKLSAYRQAPLVHSQACGFTPRGARQGSRESGR